MNLQLSNTKLVKLWQIIFADETIYKQKAFRYYVEGYYAEGAKPILLLNYLFKFAPDFSSNKLNATQAYLLVFNKKRLSVREFDMAQMQLRHLLSDLFLRTEEYIIQAKALYDAQNYPSETLLELYGQAALKTCFEDYWRKTEPLINNLEIAKNQGFTFLAKRANAQQAYLNYAIQMQYYDRLNFEALETALHDTIIAQLLYFQNSVAVFEVDYQRKNKRNLLDKLLDNDAAASQTHDTGPPLVAAYRYLTLGTKSQDTTKKEHAIQAFLILFAKFQHIFTKNECADMLELANNCIGQLIQYDRFNDDYFRLLLEIYRLQEASSCLLSNDGVIGTIFYKNVVTVALVVGELAFAKQFTATYKDKQLAITIQQRTDAQETYQYNLAQIAFFEKRYNEVEKLLRFNETQYSILSFHAEILVLKAYFEQDLLDLWGKYIETPERPNSFLLRLQQFQQRIIREKATHIDRYRHFATILLAIANVYKTHRIGTKIVLSAQFISVLFDENSPTFEERWLRTKIKMGTKE